VYLAAGMSEVFLKKEAKQKDRNKNEEKNHYISRINGT